MATKLVRSIIVRINDSGYLLIQQLADEESAMSLNYEEAFSLFEQLSKILKEVDPVCAKEKP